MQGVAPRAAYDRPDRRAVADWTLERLHELIFEGELRVGEPLSEVELCARLGVSRSPIRDALKELEHAGLLEVDDVNGRRTLRAFGLDDVAESYDVRVALECLAAQNAAKQQPLSIARIASSLSFMQAGLEQPLDAWLTLDFAFHREVARASGARRIPYLLSGIWIQHHAFLRRLDRVGLYPSTASGREAVMLEHKAIADAIAAGDGGGAVSAVRNHLRRRRDAVLRDLRGAGHATL